MQTEIAQPWKSFLEEVDSRLEGTIELHCLGGFVLTQVYGLPRTTADLDVVTVASQSSSVDLKSLAGKGSLLHKKFGVFLDIVGVAALPEDYESRLAEIFPGAFRQIRLLALEPYDIALSKLERNSQRDRDDVKFLARKVPLDLATLTKRFEEELKPILGNPKRESLTLRLWLEAIAEERAISGQAEQNS